MQQAFNTCNGRCMTKTKVGDNGVRIRYKCSDKLETTEEDRNVKIE